MSSTGSSNTSASWLLLPGLLALAGCAAHPPTGRLLYSDNFQTLEHWRIEAELPAQVAIRDGELDIDTPAGITLWFEPELTGPVRIEFDATAVSEGGPNDQVSDLNVFWMASNADGQAPVFAKPRGGKFAEYNDLLTYYAGLGGNRNSTSRFRRYIGDPVVRPLLPEHDLSSPSDLLVPNKKQRITLVADSPAVEFRRDGRVMFSMLDAAPYVHGWFALRTTWSHLRIDNLRIYSLGRH